MEQDEIAFRVGIIESRDPGFKCPLTRRHLNQPGLGTWRAQRVGEYG